MTATEEKAHRLRPYPSYKDSGVEWIGEIPEGWETKKIKALSQLENGFVFPPDSWAAEGIPIIRIENFTNKERYNYATSTIPSKHHVKKGDLLFSWSASLGPYVWDQEGDFYLNQHIFKVETKNDKKWLFYNLLGASEYLKNQMHGSAMTHITRSKLDNMLLPVPPLGEQQAIAAFLDRETARIDELMREQEALLDDLSDKRQATATKAIVGGLDQHAALKDTLLPWLGHIPVHWGLKPLKHLLRDLDQGWSPECENRPTGEDEWGVLKLSAVTGGIFRADEHKTLPGDLDPVPDLTLREGDVLVTRANTRSLVGATAVVPQDCPTLMISDLIYRLRVLPELYSPHYLTAILQSPVGRAVIELNAKGSSHTMVKIPKGVLLNMVVPVPPLEEQQAIAAYLDEQLAQIDELCEEVRANIEDMRIHRSALITAAVTGKIDVRPEAE